MPVRPGDTWLHIPVANWGASVPELKSRECEGHPAPVPVGSHAGHGLCTDLAKLKVA